MTDAQQRAAAKQFVKDWTGHGDEKQQTQRFWIALLQNVFGVEKATNAIEFEVPVKLSHTSFIDGYLKDTNVLIEQKGSDIDLRKGYRQSDGSMLTPFQQARRYAGYLPHNMNPRWIVVCNFKEFHIHDMNRPNDTPEVILLSELEKEYHRLQFLVDTGNERIQKEMQISLQAGELVGKLYDSLLKQYKNPGNPASLKSLNMLCVRLVFCLYAEDAGIFGKHGMFHDYLRDIPASGVRKALVELFRILDTKPECRDPYLADDNPTLAAFPYVNGGLFADENIEIPPFTEGLKALLLSNASEDFDWSEISPTIFGAVFESTLNPETRRSGGMHYTSIENIHKVIDPLFLDGLKAELEEARGKSVAGGARSKAIQAFHEKLSSLTFLDPACGSGNFLTETYLSLRRLENEIIREIYSGIEGQMGMGEMAAEIMDSLQIKVSIGQFYGIEINDFAVTVAKTALWIAESQMLKETEEIVHMHMDFLPLTSYANIVEGNALRIDWETVVPKEKLNYIMGNPPFVGKKEQTKLQKAEVLEIYGKGISGVGNMDYVTCWYIKAAEYMQSTSIRAAFVSTNSITQGEQPPVLWSKLNQYGASIIFAYRTFIWASEATEQAHVHCVIIGFYIGAFQGTRRIFTDGRYIEAKWINPYLLDAPTLLISSRSKPISDVPEMCYGSMPIDNNNLILDEDAVQELIKENPNNKMFIREYVGGDELLNGKKRWCLWLDGISPELYMKSKYIMGRIEQNREYRLYDSTRPQTNKAADTPHLFGEIRQPENGALVIPKVSSEDRRYIPISYVEPGIIINGSALMIPNATYYHFGVLSSNVHNAWMRVIAGRMKSDYQYSAGMVYNNFPWPSPTEDQKKSIEETARAVLAARSNHPTVTLAKMYKTQNFLLFADLKNAHDKLNRTVMEAYGFWGKLNTETECVAELMKMYQELTK